MYRPETQEEWGRTTAASGARTPGTAARKPRSWASSLKRIVDVVAAASFFVFFGWLFLLICIGVALTTGRPILYGHERLGKNGRRFTCLKFRSMVADSDVVLREHLSNCAEARLEWERDFKLRNDPRITRFGRFIRRTSLDELPQFWNVLKGEMSLVGPRPVTSAEIQRYYGDLADDYFSVRPGITGLWQVSGRSHVTYSERVRLDSRYVRNWSLAGDVVILFKTVFVVISREGSH